MNEKWKDCYFDSRYKISNLGNIKRILSNGDERILKPSILNKNKTHPYYYFQIKKKGKKINYLIHRLVAFAFCDGHSDINNICDHIDRNTFNNNYTNLRWGTHKDNMNNSIKNINSNLTGIDRKRFISNQSLKKIKDSKKYYCELCETKFRSQDHQEIHNNGYCHKLKIKALEELGNNYNKDSYKKWKAKRCDEKRKETRKEFDRNKYKIMIKYNCECGGKYTSIHKERHFKTIKHQTFCNNQDHNKAAL
tara:strand:+ start:80 stop:829 length:750 start_codon:yes stop_codon:yes gene_type:complete